MSNRRRNACQRRSIPVASRSVAEFQSQTGCGIAPDGSRSTSRADDGSLDDRELPEVGCPGGAAGQAGMQPVPGAGQSCAAEPGVRPAGHVRFSPGHRVTEDELVTVAMWACPWCQAGELASGGGALGPTASGPTRPPAAVRPGGLVVVAWTVIVAPFRCAVHNAVAQPRSLAEFGRRMQSRAGPSSPTSPVTLIRGW